MSRLMFAQNVIQLVRFVFRLLIARHAMLVIITTTGIVIEAAYLLQSLRLPMLLDNVLRFAQQAPLAPFRTTLVQLPVQFNSTVILPLISALPALVLAQFVQAILLAVLAKQKLHLLSIICATRTAILLINTHTTVLAGISVLMVVI